MFFILSKLLLFLLSPYIWIILLLIFAFFTKKPRQKRKALFSTIILLYFFGNMFIANEVIRQWEVPTIPVEKIEKTYDYGIVLGGFNTYDNQLDRINFNKASDRLWQALMLYKQGYIRKIIITGGEGRIIKEGYTEGETTRDFLLKIGIPKEDLLIECESRNTHENAVFTAQLLGEKKENCSYVLITSAIHMKRAAGCFKKEGFNFIQFSTDRIAGPTKFLVDYCFIPESSAINLWRSLIKEVVGYLVYAMVGHI